MESQHGKARAGMGSGFIGFQKILDIIIHLPFLPGVNHQEQYHIYHLLQSSPYQHEKRTKRDMHKIIYGS